MNAGRIAASAPVQPALRLGEFVTRETAQFAISSR
jgi:hypothetical protein